MRLNHLILSISVGLLSWYGMMAVHEFGHVIAAYATGGTVLQVVLEPLSISHTEYGELPQPGVVVWSGPILGSVLPLALVRAGKLARFFAGFCLIANGAYIGVGSFGGIGDCGLMLLTGTPIWVMWLFSAVTFPSGLYLWHGLGTLADFWRWRVGTKLAYSALGVLSFVVLSLLLLR